MPALHLFPKKWAELRNCPTRNETACVIAGTNRHIDLLFFNGTNWADPTDIVSDMGTTSCRPFDLAYESVSGNLLVAYWSVADSKIGYRTAASGTVSGQSLLALPSGTQVTWVRLCSNPTANEIFLLAVNTDGCLYSSFWNGSSWGSVDTLTSAIGTSTYECIAGAFESFSGKAIVAYSVSGSNNLRYRTSTAATWSTETIAADIGGVGSWVQFAPQPYSNKILCAILDDQYDLNALLWNGSTWETPQQLETSANILRRSAIAFQGCGPQAVYTYNDMADTTKMRYRIWDGSSWGAEQTDTSHAIEPELMLMKSGPGYGEILSLDLDCNVGSPGVNSRHSYGLSWGDFQQVHNLYTTVGTISTPAWAPPTPAAIPYSIDFEGTVGAEWSNNLVTSNGTLTKFAGRHFKSAVELALTTTIGQTYDLVFDLYCTDSWNGNLDNDTSAPDYFLVLADGTEVFRHTFTHEYTDTQGASYPYPYDQKGNYGFGGSQDAIYRKVEVLFTAARTTTILTFLPQFENENETGIDDEAWGIDNLTVESALFKDVSSAKGFSFNTTTDAETYGSSFHWADFNADGWLDAVVTGDSASKLLINTTGAPRTFTVSAFGGGAICPQGAVLDADNDGDIDFWGLTTAHGLNLFLNNASATFTNSSASGCTSGPAHIKPLFR